jgi:hypothetical protein
MLSQMLLFKPASSNEARRRRGDFRTTVEAVSQKPFVSFEKYPQKQFVSDVSNNGQLTSLSA